MKVALTPLVSSRLILCIAGASLLSAHAVDVEPGLTEMEGAVRTWQMADGLPADSVTAIIRTSDGFLWVGTSAGLVRFDGVKFTRTRLNESATSPGIFVTALCEDKDGHLWIGTQRDGLFELARGKVSQFTKARGLLDDNVTSLAADNNGLVWIGTRSGLNVAEGTRFKSFTTRDGLPDELVSGVHVARSGTVWITTRGGMCRFIDEHLVPYALRTESQGRSPEYLGVYEDRRGNLWAFGDTYLINLADNKRFNYFRGNEASSVRIWSLCESGDGRLWIGTSGRGLFCFDDNRFQPVVLGELRWSYDVRAICEDREGNLWLGTSGGGLAQLRTHPVRVLRAGQGLPAGSATSLGIDAAGRVLVGLQRGGLFAGDAGRFEQFGNGGGSDVPDFISSICLGRDGVLWAGTLGGGLYALQSGRGVRFTTADGLADNLILSVCADAEGAIWAGTSAGALHRCTAAGISRFDTKDGLPGSAITAVIPSSAGGLWLGTEDGAVFRGNQGRFTLALRPQAADPRPILALHEGTQGQLWVGTAGNGLVCLWKGLNFSWKTGSGIPSDVVPGIVEDAAGNLWLATAAGICQASRNAVDTALSNSQTAFACKLISDAKTLWTSGTPFGAIRAVVSPQGSLWFATSEGVLNIDARQPDTELSSMPVYMESVSLNGRPAFSVLRAAAWSEGGPTNALTVHSDLTSLDVWFTAPSLSAPDKIRFRHKLEGSDPDWVDDGTTRFAHYSRLPYGQYRFHVAARRPEGLWEEAVVPFAFEIPTPIYLRSWALVLYGLAAVGFVAGAVRMVSHRRLRRALAQLEQQQSLERERMRIARDMHDEMGSKLTKLSFLSEHAKVEADSNGALARKMGAIAETSRELLQAMDEIVWVVNPRNDTLEQLAAYLGHYAVEYFQSTSVQCDLRLPRAIPDHPLSSEARHNLFLAFEEALNNTLKHSTASNVKIEMLVKAPDFEIQITDNGRGFEVPGPTDLPRPTRGGHGGQGLRNMYQRLAEIGGECLVRSPVTPEGGTVVSMRIHLNGNSAKV
jgi:ligand-binding sensor domain-containing protein/signal transduction histidine kinase